jgi:transcription initiation factor TFIIIB Brf1 subunit/transcription initiation factor TFIIB
MPLPCSCLTGVCCCVAVSAAPEGYTVCRRCATVQEAEVIDENPEWNVYADSEGKGDPSRVGGSLDDASADAVWAKYAGAGKGKKRSLEGQHDLGAEKKSRGESKMERILMGLADVVSRAGMDERLKAAGQTIAGHAKAAGVLERAQPNTCVAALLFLAGKASDVVVTLKEAATWAGADPIKVGTVHVSQSLAVSRLSVMGQSVAMPSI